MAFYGMTQGSLHEVKPAKPSMGADWNRVPSEYDKGKLKGIRHKYEYPTNLNSTRDELLNSRPYNPSPGTMASDTPGIDWQRNPQAYSTYRLKGKTNDPAFRLAPFNAPTVMKQVSNFKEHFAIQDRLHPFRTALGDLPQVFAQAKATEDAKVAQQQEYARRVAAMQAAQIPGAPANLPGNPIQQAVAERNARNAVRDEFYGRVGSMPKPEADEVRDHIAFGMNDNNVVQGNFSTRDIMIARDKLEHVGPNDKRPYQPEESEYDRFVKEMRNANLQHHNVNEQNAYGIIHQRSGVQTSADPCTCPPCQQNRIYWHPCMGSGQV